ncbi:hypothetical protein [Burkholderia pseudomallei]|uniref:hypothetical protein n=1 Tax=Burkholderia pseudomallei TaxID=28450 RepID=UPI000F074B1C|nr:hypothetical protein [Burkholderia pseudomallei]VBF49890.1 Type I restriction-modification system methyltransferase subunit [Burkholderia pseudomallei]VBQ49621.1 Type I restriction-modification system methyltransferase subunit [Burkholderia pseudomallei]
MPMEYSSPPRFKPGRLIMTAGVDALIHEGRLNPLPYLRRHLRADWGDLCEPDWRQNNAALPSGDRLLSSYTITPDITLWIITEGDRSVTTLLLPSEY